jgi:8-oxo-dGTP pyrophosphatase MutT (NUDIX family)
MSSLDKSYDHLKWKTVDSTYIYQDNWFNARKETAQKPDGSLVSPYYVLDYTPWVTALALTEDNKVILAVQYRHALGEVGYELPGGCVDATDADLETAIRRELLEETGYAFETVHYLGRVSPNPSTNANLMHMFIATGGRLMQAQALDANEEIEVLLISIEELIQLIEEKRIVQSMHLSTIFYALRYLGKLGYKL